jgi:2,3-diketo-5-methylthio-1-phosphopentane phosphatase
MNAPALPVQALVIDFDGTICPHDVSEELLDAFASAEWWDIDLAFQRGEIGSRECLVRQVALLGVGRDDLLRHAVERYRLEPSFGPFVQWARGAGIEVIVASDGMGFYVEPMLDAAGIQGVTVLTNDVTPGESDHPDRFSFPNGHPVCVGCGTCKMLAVQGARQRFGPVAFVGEGHTDRYGALYADVVFAKKHLVDICRQDGVSFHPWESFEDVRAALEGQVTVPGPVAPERCPGWTDPPSSR